MFGFVFKHVSRFLVMTLVTLLIVAALLSGLLRLGLPYASSYKNEIQAWVSNYLRAPVELGAFDLAWNGFSPSLSLTEVTLKREGDQRVDIKLDEILLDLNLYKSLFTGDLQINEVTLAGADLVLEYVGKQQFTIRSYGLAGSSGAGTSKSSLDVGSWLMNAGRVGLLESSIRIVDNKRDIDYRIDNLSISAENSGDLHQLRVSMGLPEQLGTLLQIDLDLTGSSDALNQSSGNFYASIQGLNLENWMRIWPDRSLDAAGTADIEFWGSWADNQLLSLRARADGSGLLVADSGAANHPAQRFPSLSTDMFWQRGANGWRAEIDKLDFRFGESESRIRRALVAFEEDDATGNYTLAGEGASLSLDAIGALLGELGQAGLPDSVASYARNAQLNGQLLDWALLASLDQQSTPSISLDADLVNVGALPVGKVPGVQNLSGQLRLADNSGQFQLASSDLELDMPNVFSHQLAIEKTTGTLDLSLNDRARMLASKGVSVRHQGLAAISSFVLGRDADNDLHIDLQTAAQLDNLAAVPHYLPDRIMPASATEWVSDALVAGRATSGSLLLHGKLKDFPYTSKPGLFRAEVFAEDVTLKFMPDWPAGTQLRGKAVFEGDGMRFSVQEGVLSNTTISRVDGDIVNFRKPFLNVSGATSGKLQSFIEFSNNGPLKKILSPAFEQSSGTGEAVLNLDIGVPLRSISNRPPGEVLAVDGTVFLAGNRLGFDGFDVTLENLSGAVSFSESGLTINNLNASFLDAPVRISAGTRTAGSGDIIELTAEGVLHANKVLSHYDIPVHSFFRGPSRWKVAVEIPKESGESQSVVTLNASSDLVGTIITLPEPMRKSSAKESKVAVRAQFNATGDQVWRIENDKARMHLLAEPGAGLKSLSVLLGRGAFRPRTANGIFIDGVAPGLSFDGWIETVSQIIDELPESEGAPEPVLPVYADVGAEQMVVGQRRLGAARFRANTDGDYINATVNSSHLRGSIRIPRAHWDKDRAIKSRIAYADSVLLDALSDPDGSATGEADQANPLDPTKFPRLEVHVSHFVYDTLTLRNLGLRAEPDAAGMKITALGFANENAQLIGEGTWHLSDPQQINATLPQAQQTSLSLNLQSNNFGQTLQQAGYTNLMAEGEGTISLNLNWAGPVYKPELKKLSGDGRIYVKDGRILTIDPGAARLVGLIALQELPRRLSLDFRDLVNNGLDYKRISGNVTLGNGLAKTDVLRLEGTIGVVEIQGTSDLVAQSFDQRIRVLPRVSAALPIIGILSGGASAGIGALLVGPVLKAFGIDIDRIGLAEYAMTGSWDKPEIEQLTQTHVNLNAPERE